VDNIPNLIVPERELKGRREEKGQKESGSNTDKPFLIGGGFDPLQQRRCLRPLGVLKRER